MSASTASHHTSTGTHMRVTRRGRLLLLVALVAVLFGAFSLGRAASQAAPPATASAPAPRHVTVQAGESLWSLALRTAPEHDPRDVVAQIRDLNDLDSPHVQPGQLLVLPVAA